MSPKLETAAEQFLNPQDMNVWLALRLAIPLVATSFIFCLIGAVDMALAGWQSAAAQAAVGIADQCIFATMLVGTGLAAATGCFVSQSLGASDLTAARDYARDGILLSIIFGVLSAIVCFCGASTLVDLCGCSPAAKAVALPYLQSCALGNLPFMIVLVQASIMRSVGRTADCLRLWLMIGFVSIAGGVGLYFLTDYPLSNLLSHSLISLAVAWDLGAVVGVIYGTDSIRRNFLDRKGSSHSPKSEVTQTSLCGARKSSRYSLSTSKSRLNKFRMVGVPVLLSEACSVLTLGAVYSILGRLPDSETLQAAYTVTLKIEETFGILPLLAVSTVSATLIGHQVGAKLIGEAKTLGWQLALSACAVMLVGGVLVREAGPALGIIFTSNDLVLRQISVGTECATISLPLIALASILFANLEGAGLTAHSLTAQFVGYILCRLPLAYTLAVVLDFGYSGVWLAIVISRVVTAIHSMALYKMNFRAYTTDFLVESKSMPNSAK